MRTVALALTVLTITACSPKQDDALVCHEQTPAAVAGKDSVLVVGDSISMHMMSALETSLPAYDVQHNPCNAMNSYYAAKHITQWTEARNRWSAIIFNVGQWDVEYTSTFQKYSHTTDTQYRANLTKIARVIKARTDHPYFFLSTEVPPKEPTRSDAELRDKNAVALEVMRAEGIPAIDLYSVSKTILPLHQRAAEQDDVHWTDQGSAILVEALLTNMERL